MFNFYSSWIEQAGLPAAVAFALLAAVAMLVAPVEDRSGQSRAGVTEPALAQPAAIGGGRE